jgi:DNA (cytosine-5)-methyltransferase 1
LNYLDLFHGIGGFALGAYWAGMKFENHYCSDIEPWCQKLYAQRFPDSIQLGDIAKINAQDLPAGEWILSGGFPCQDISIAGKGAGIHGDRSGLWFEYWRLIRDLRPRFAIMENVGMLVHRGLREVLGSLAEIGYDAEWQDIRASDVGAPHRRERIWIVAYAGYTESSGWECDQEGLQYRGRRPSRRESTPCGNVADASIPRLEGQESARGGPGELGLPAECGDISTEKDMANTKGERFNNGDDCKLLGQTSGKINTSTGAGGNIGKLESGWWSTEPAVRGVVNGLPAELHGYEGRLAVKSHQRMDRLRGLGNAIVPQIAELLFRQIKNLL